MYAEADEVLKRLKVDVNSVHQRVESLSGGRQQSVAIARAISFDPRVIILDEPTANLSVMATQRLLETMLELKKHGVAQIIISHGCRILCGGPGDGAEGGENGAQGDQENTSRSVQIIVRGSKQNARVYKPGQDEGKRRLEETT